MVTPQVVWVVFAFVTGVSVGALAAVILGRRAEGSWRVAYLNARDRLWKLERDQEGA